MRQLPSLEFDGLINEAGQLQRGLRVLGAAHDQGHYPEVREDALKKGDLHLYRVLPPVHLRVHVDDIVALRELAGKGLVDFDHAERRPVPAGCLHGCAHKERLVARREDDDRVVMAA